MSDFQKQQRTPDFGDALDVRQIDTQLLNKLTRVPVELTFVSEEIVDGVRITRGTLPSGTPFVLEKQASE